MQKEILGVIDKTVTVASVGLDIFFNNRIVVNSSNSVAAPDGSVSIGMSSILGTSICRLYVAGIVKLPSFILVGLFIFR